MTGAPAVDSAGPGMRPAYAGGCLGWLHHPSGPVRNAGVLLCPALGREGRWTYRFLRKLADRLAADGLPCFRFDYPGTGESAEAQGGQPVAAWRNGVQGAADWLRAEAGVDHLVLAGLRFGALLAAEAACSRRDVAAAALLAPALSGRRTVRELRLAAIGGAGNAAVLDGIELDGIPLAEADLAEIAAVDLTQPARSPGASVLLLGEDGPATHYAGRLRELGAEVEQRPFPGYDQLMRVATSNQVPRAALDGVAEWAGRLPVAQQARRAAPGCRTGGAPLLRQASWCERPVQFGPARRLAGVLCEPRGTAAARCLLIVNTGGDARAGIGRFGVRLARHLAGVGVASFRLDFAGLGDSRMEEDTDSHLYRTDRSADIAAALDAMEAHGYARLGGIGLCTGAYHLLHAAPVDARLQALVLVNLVTFRWRPGDVVEVAQRAVGQPAPFDAGRGADRGAADPLPRRLLHGHAARGGRTLLVYGFDDPGIAQLEANFGRAGERLAGVAGVRVAIERGIDHTLSRRDMQDQVASVVTSFLAAGDGGTTESRPERRAGSLESAAGVDRGC